MDNNQNNSTNSEQPQENPSAGVPPTSPSSSVSPQAMPERSPVNTEPNQPTPSSDESTVVSSGSGDNKKPLGIMIGALLVLIVVFLGLLFFFVFNRPGEPEPPTQQVPVEDLQPTPTSAVTPTPELSEDTVDGIDIGSPEAELSPIQEDLEELN